MNQERFFEKINKQGSTPPSPPYPPDLGQCWIWTAATYRDGYGAFMVDGKLTRAHRHSWEIHFGAIPEGLGCLHKCDNPPCVNPNHLFLGTCQDNSDDMIKKGRHVGNRKLCPKDVESIREQYSAGGQTIYSLAQIFNLTPQGIWKVIHAGWKGIKKCQEIPRTTNMPRGERHHKARLTDEKVRAIREAYQFGNHGSGAYATAKRFGISKQTVLRVIHRTNWKHVV